MTPDDRSAASAMRTTIALANPTWTAFEPSSSANQQDRVDAVRSDRAALEFRGKFPDVRDQLVKELGEQVTVQESDWNAATC